MSRAYIAITAAEATPLSKLQIGGMSVLQRLLFTLAKAGYREAILTGDLVGEDIAGALPERLTRQLDISFLPVMPGSDLIKSIAKSQGSSTQAVTLLGSDLVVAPTVLGTIREAHVSRGNGLVAVSETLDIMGTPQDHLDIVKLSSGLLERLTKHDIPSISALTTHPSFKNRSAALQVDGYHQKVTSPTQKKTINRYMLETLKKPLDESGIFGYLWYRSISTRISAQLVKLGIHPNAITAAAGIIGVLGGIIMAFGGWTNAIIGAALLQLSGIVDCCDGEVARLSFKTTKIGCWLDTIFDDVTNFFFIGGMTLNIYWAWQHPSILVIGALALTGFAIGQLYMYHILRTEYGTGYLLEFRWAFQGEPTAAEELTTAGKIIDGAKYLVKRDFFITFFLAMAVVNLVWVAWGFSIIGAVAVFGMLLNEMRVRATKKPVRQAIPTLVAAPAPSSQKKAV